jgi:hypothetical protein
MRFSDEVYLMIEMQFKLMLRGKELGIDNMLQTSVELYRYFHNGCKDMEKNKALTYDFLFMYCEKKELNELKDVITVIIPDFLRLFVGASYGIIKLDFIKEEKKKKKRFGCF